jgi:hypothetical protein
MAKNTPLLVVAALFFSLSLYLLFSAPDESLESPSTEPASASSSAHPCPYADILGLDEHSVNPHGAGGHLPPMTNVQSHVDQRQFEPTAVQSEAPTAPAATPDPVDAHYVSRSDFDRMPPVPPSEIELKQEL